MFLGSSTASAGLIYQNNFDNPVNWVESRSYQDMSQQSVNALFGSTFAQTNTVETIKTHGGSYYSDPSGTGGDYAISMLSHLQDDKLFLTFDPTSNNFVNVQLDLSNIGARYQNGGYQAGLNSSTAPTMQLSLYSGGSLLSSSQITGSSTSDQSVFDWTNFIVALDTTGNNGSVTLEFDLLSGNYAAFDNLTIYTADVEGDVGQPVPAPAGLPLLAMGLASLIAARRKV